MILPRWTFPVDPSPDENAAHDEVITHIEAWWQAFEEKVPELLAFFANEADWDLAAWIHPWLHAIHPALRWDFGPALHGPGHRLTLTPEGDCYLRPLATEVIRRAPVLDMFEFYAYRIQETPEETEERAQVETGTSIENIWVNARMLPSQHIGLEFHSPDFAAKDDQLAYNTVFVATEALLGEQRFDQWIGPVSVFPIKKKSGGSSLAKTMKPQDGSGPVAGATHISELATRVDELIEDMRSSLTDSPVRTWCDTAEWNMYDLETQATDDDAARRYDLHTSVTILPDVWEAAHGPGYFYSERFTLNNEIFCYLKIDGVADWGSPDFKDRTPLEEAVHKALTKAEVGACSGSGNGHRYAYVDLVIEDMDAAIPIIREVCQNAKVPKRSWLQFYDSIWTAEWVGVYPDSPQPPLAETSRNTGEASTSA